MQRPFIATIALIALGTMAANAADQTAPTPLPPLNEPALRGTLNAPPPTPILPRPPSYTRWSGFYVGGQLGYNAANADFSSLVYAQTGLEQQGVLPTTLWPTLGAATDHGEAAYGGFIGYNAHGGPKNKLRARQCTNIFRLYVEAACWAHARRKFFDLARINQAPIASEAVGRIDALFAIEREINGLAPQQRLGVRTERSRPLVTALESWLRELRRLGTKH